MGIILNENARNIFVLIAPVIAKSLKEAFKLSGVSTKPQTSHHKMSTVVFDRQENNVQQLSD